MFGMPSMSSNQLTAASMIFGDWQEVVVAEWAVRADGTKEKTQTVLRLPNEAALNLEE